MQGGRLSPYASPSATREVLERHGLYTKYALGQNFLVSDDVVRKIVELACVQPSEHVLEVGPGIGTLTAALLQRAGRVTAIEKDDDLPAVLADTLEPWADAFTLVSMDALDVDEAVLAARTPSLPTKLVSNLPYAVAATVTLDYLRRFDFLESLTVMVQKEVAERMMARPATKAYGAYTAKLALYAHVSGHFGVAPGNFFPPPHVDSTVVRLERAQAVDAAGRPLSSAQLQACCHAADAAFANRRKTLANSCKTYFVAEPDLIMRLPALFEQAGVDPRRRGETLTQAEFVRLGCALNEVWAGRPSS